MLAPMPPRVWAARPGDVMNRAVLLMLGGIALGAAALPARAEAQAQTQAQTPADCPAPTVSVQSAKKFIDTKVDPGAGQGAVKPADDIVQLGDTIELTMTGLPELLADLDCRKTKGLPRRTLVLFLAAQPIKGLAGYMPGPPSLGKMRFDLAHTDSSKAAWALVLARPSTTPRDIDVSIGYDDSYPFPGTTMPFRSLAVTYAVLSVVFIVLLLVGFIYLFWGSGICRDGKPSLPEGVTGLDPIAPRALGPFSLSKVQAAIWFFVILGAYLLIVAVTHDISGTMNATALTLMGIGAATVVGSAAIQSNQSQAADIAQQEDQAKKLAQQMKELQDKLIAKKGTQDERIIRKSLRDTEFAFRRATNQSTGLWNDIVSDANGVNFHRFQMAAWTIVLASIFAIAVMRVLAMPDFDSTLLALQGLSAGTFLGLKITEPTVTDVPAKPDAAK